MVIGMAEHLGYRELQEKLDYKNKNYYQWNKWNKKYKNYSFGMKEKLGIIQVLMENPDIIILDEPFNGLDDKSKEVLKEILLQRKKENKLIIFSSHIKEEINDISDYVYLFEEGKINIIKGILIWCVKC